MAIAKTKVKQGWLEGTDCGAYALYKGIPFAKPPVGELRFRAPKPPESWTGLRKAQDFPKICWQEEPEDGSFYDREFYHRTWKQEKRSEDCLYLNIWTPAKGTGDKLPVMLWIHGGALQHGYGHEPEFDGEAFCRRDVILVSIQYRLGIFGFFSHPWTEREDWEEKGCNFALLDQIAALDWVYENIASFGGDPAKITLAGQSAGGVSVQAMLCSGLTRGKVHRAILQSGGGYGQLDGRSVSLREAGQNAAQFLEKSGIGNLRELRALDAKKLLELSKGFSCRFVRDGHVLDEEGERALYRDASCVKAYLLGSTLDDIRVTPRMRENGIHGDLYEGNKEFMRRLCGKSDVFLYYFIRQLPGDEAGAFHSSELWYMFGTLDRSWRPFTKGDHDLAEQMADYWCSFIKGGKPAGADEWKACTDREITIKELDVAEE